MALDKNEITYHETLKNVKNTENIRGEILKAVRNAEPIEHLFMKSCEAISLMTGDRSFLQQIKEDMVKLYGYCLKDEEILSEREKELKDCLDKVKKYKSEEEKNLNQQDINRLNDVIRGHEKEIAKIEKIK